MDPMQQFFQNQMQLLENLTNTVAHMQAHANNPPQPPPQQSAPMNQHREFMSTVRQFSPMLLIHLMLMIG
jgi:hypothetical protein